MPQLRRAHTDKPAHYKEAILCAVANRARMEPEAVERVVETRLEALRVNTWRRGRVLWPGFAVFRLVRTAGRTVECEGKRYRVPAMDVVKVRATRDWRAR